MSLCVGDKETTRSSCSLIMKLTYQADLLLCRLWRVIQSARNLGCTRQGCVLWVSEQTHWPEVSCMLNIHYYTTWMFLCHYCLVKDQSIIINFFFTNSLLKQHWFNNLKTNTQYDAQWEVMLTYCLILDYETAWAILRTSCFCTFSQNFLTLKKFKSSKKKTKKLNFVKVLSMNWEFWHNWTFEVNSKWPDFKA